MFRTEMLLTTALQNNQLQSVSCGSQVVLNEGFAKLSKTPNGNAVVNWNSATGTQSSSSASTQSAGAKRSASK
jgi:hypothetical protein